MGPRSGFTLVEVVAALGAFAIAFLSSFGAISALMLRQETSYRSTLAATAAMLVLGRAAHTPSGATYPSGDLRMNAGLECVDITTALGTAINPAFLADVSVNANRAKDTTNGMQNITPIILKNGDQQTLLEAVPGGTISAFTFNPTCLVDGNTLNMSGYRSLLLTVCQDRPAIQLPTDLANNTVGETWYAKGGMIWRQASFYAGDALLLENKRPGAKFTFVGSYLYAAPR